MVWRGEFLTADTSESPSGAVASTLSDVLESQLVPERYYLSARAAAGILRRAERRGKRLPPRLEQALRAVAGTEATLTTKPMLEVLTETSDIMDEPTLFKRPQQDTI